MDWARKHLDGLAPYVPGMTPQQVAQRYGVADALKLASNESPLGPAPGVWDAVRRAASQLARYPDDHVGALRERIAPALGVRGQELVFGHGSNELIDLLCRTVVGPDQHAVCGDPSFVAYALCLQSANIPFTRVPLRGRLYWDLDAVLAAVRPETRLVFVDNPNNPTSTHISSAALAAFLKAIPEEVTVVLDEAYAEFVDAPDHVSGLQLRDLHERLVVLRTFSKAHGLAAARVGYAIAPAPLVDYLNRVRLPFNVNGLGQAAAIASLDDPAHLAHYVALNREQRARLLAGLRDLGLAPAPSQANFVTVSFGHQTADLHEALLRMGVIVRPIAPPLEDALRISVGLARENDRLLAAVSQLYRPDDA